MAQNSVITGKVTDEKKLQLPGASIAIVGTKLGTISDVNGMFKISGQLDGSYTIAISFTGYLPQQKKVLIKKGETINLQVQLFADLKSLSEVVVIGYGSQKKQDLTGSVANVSAKDFQKGVITSPEQLIAGKVAGVSVVSNGGAPGAGSTIRIRGGASLNASNDPLIVIDGVPINNSSIAGSTNPLSMLNPNDIESFSVLKDASAAAIYGNRASNGVILVTTKKGQRGKPVINFSSQFAISKLIKTVSVLSPEQFHNYINENDATAGGTFKKLLGHASTDWQKEIYQTALSTDNNLSIASAVKGLPYRLSVGYLDQNGILKTGALQRVSADLSLNPVLLSNHLKINVNIKAAQAKQRFANENAIGSAVSFDPTQPVYSSSDRFGGYYEWLDPSSANGLKSLAQINPLSLLHLQDNHNTVFRSIGNVQLDYKLHFLPDLHLNVNVGYDIAHGNGEMVVIDSAAAKYKRFKDPNGIFHGGVNNRYKQSRENKLFESYLSYAKEIPALKSRIDAVAGYSYQDFLTTDYNYPDQTFDLTIVKVPNFAYDKPQNRLVSFYGRLNYIFNEKYLLTATLRRDGSSRFNPDKRFGLFPSVALAWKVKQESFLNKIDAISDLKIRLGYGVTGQQEGIGLYDYISYFNLSSATDLYQFGDTYYNQYRPGGYFYNRTWEETASANIGVDFGFFDSRITGSIDYYHRKTTNLLNLITQPAGSNFSNKIIANVGDMQNKGLEFNINGQLLKRDDVDWSIGINATYNQNKITKLTIAPDPSYIGNPVGSGSGGLGADVQINSIGYPRASYYVFQQIYDSNGKPVDGEFEDRNHDGVVNQQDMYRLKNPDPKFYLGFNSALTYKKWTAGFTARASLGNYAYNKVFATTGVQRSIINYIGVLNNGSTNVLESGLSGNSDKNQLSDYYVQDASFLRMDNINVGYNFGKIFSKTAELRLNFSVQNVFVITKYKGLDPEISNGIDYNLYPRPRTYALGLNLSL